LENELGNGWTEGVHPHDLDHNLNTYSSSFSARRSFQMEYRLRRADGEYRWLLDNGVPRFERGGVFVGYIGSCIDITDLKQRQEESLARQKLESVGTLASGIAHDFNNLLGGVLSQAELALEELAAGLLPEEELKRIRAVAIRGSEIVRQLMIYAGKETEVVELVDVSRITEEMLELLKASVSKHAVLETDLGKDLPAVRANAAQLRQVVMNLITNASEAIGDRNGAIRVTTRRVFVGRNSAVTASERLSAGDYLQLEVSDTGRGMAPETQARVFDPFFTTKSAGRGLGLPVVHGIVRGLHGAIRLTSAPGAGSTFQILLPCAVEPGQTVQDTISQATDEGVKSRAATILIVEDEELLLQATAKMLRKAGFSAVEAIDGSAGLDAIRGHQNPIDVLLLDLTLPGTPSRDVLEEGNRLRPEMKVIVTSAYNEAMAAASLGVTIERFIRKPYRLDDLVALVRQAISS
jgi:two-component system, cell cycle sensor histidine kinase and response regulator CckA